MLNSFEKKWLSDLRNNFHLLFISTKPIINHIGDCFKNSIGKINKYFLFQCKNNDICSSIDDAQGLKICWIWTDINQDRCQSGSNWCQSGSMSIRIDINQDQYQSGSMSKYLALLPHRGRRRWWHSWRYSDCCRTGNHRRQPPAPQHSRSAWLPQSATGRHRGSSP